MEEGEREAKNRNVNKIKEERNHENGRKEGKERKLTIMEGRSDQNSRERQRGKEYREKSTRNSSKNKTAEIKAPVREKGGKKDQEKQ